MSVSSINSPSAPLPFDYLDTNTQATPSAAPADGGSDSSSAAADATSSQPPAPPPLPPGQGSRVNQLA
jgi:hypothetical protein